VYVDRVPSAGRGVDQSLLVRGPGAHDQRLAATVAAQIVDDVGKQGWPIGAVIGSEAALLERYEVSRAVFREAVRLVEHQHVARMRRGPGGGLVVIEPDVTAVIDAAIIYLLRVGARLDEVFQARLVIEDIVCGIAPVRATEEDRAEVRTLAAAEASGEAQDPRAMHLLLGRATGNPAFDLFTELLNRMTDFYVSKPREIEQRTFRVASHAHYKIAEAVLAGDGEMARRRMARHLHAEADYIRARRSTRQHINMGLALRGVDGHKRAEAVTREIVGRVVGEELPPGTLLGSEAELMAEYDVSRAVLREAVRLLEHHRIARMRRGPGGGLFVVPEDVTAISDVVAVHLTRKHVDQGHLAEARVGIELALVDLVAAGDHDVVAARLEAALAAEARATAAEMAEAVHDLHATLASLGGNRVLELLARILLRLTRLQDRRRPAQARKAIREEIHKAHHGISQAIVEGDAVVARRRMRAHLETLTNELRQ
jgi:DNA-binding FadR family transcriptional regulator